MFYDFNGAGTCKNTVKIHEERKTRQGAQGCPGVVPCTKKFCLFCQDLGNAKVLMPENTIPWGVTHFIGPTWTDSLASLVLHFQDIAGGAVMGQFPELCYSSLLQPFVDKTGMAVPWLQCTSALLMQHGEPEKQYSS